MFVNVRFVLLVMEATVPIWMLLVVLMMLPTLSSVRNAVPVPATLVFPAVTVIVPERRVLGQAVASQVPLVSLVMFKLTALAEGIGNAVNSIIAMVKTTAVLYIKVFVLVFVFIVLHGCDRGEWIDSSPAQSQGRFSLLKLHSLLFGLLLSRQFLHLLVTIQCSTHHL